MFSESLQILFPRPKTTTKAPWGAAGGASAGHGRTGCRTGGIDFLPYVKERDADAVAVPLRVQGK